MQLNQGRYTAEIIDNRLGKTSTGKSQCVVRFRLTGKIEGHGPDEEIVQCSPEERTMYWVVTDKTVDFVTEKARRIGFKGTKWSEFDPNHGGNAWNDLTGTPIRVEMNLDSYQGKEIEKWDLERGASERPLDQTEAHELDAMFGSALKSSPAAEDKERPKAASSSSSKDLPF